LLTSRKKIRRRPREERPLLDELLGARAAARTRTVAVLIPCLLFFGGCALFLFESQTFGRIALALGLGGGLFWAAIRYLARSGDDPLQAVARRRWPLIVVSAMLVLAGWAIFLAVWEELGLLLVVLGAVPLILLIAGVKHRPLLSPTDGPPYGDTGPT
jgi:hypothetical protein